jgi:hypothetical protein
MADSSNCCWHHGTALPASMGTPGQDLFSRLASVPANGVTANDCRDGTTIIIRNGGGLAFAIGQLAAGTGTKLRIVPCRLEHLAATRALPRAACFRP